MMYCKNCGTKLENGMQACPSCGTVVNQQAEPTVNLAAQMNTGAAQKSKLAGGLLGIFLGGLGVHNFYLGYTGKAVAQLLISLLSCGFLAFISGIWGLIEGILILTGGIEKDGNGVPLRD